MLLTTTRVNQADPLSSAKHVLSDLILVANQTKHLSSASIIDARVTALQAWVSRSALDIDLAFEPRVGEHERSRLLAWIATDLSLIHGGSLRPPVEHLASPNFLVRMWEWPAPPVNLAGVPAPPVLLAEVNDGTSDFESLVRIAESYPLVLLVAEVGEIRLSRIPHCFRLNPGLSANGEAATLEAWLKAKGTPYPDLLRAMALCRAMDALVLQRRLDSAGGLLDEVFERETQEIRFKQGLIRQRLAGTQQPPVVSGSFEFLTELRGKLQRHLEAFDAALAERWNSLVATQEGPIWKQIEALLFTFTNLLWRQKSKSEVAEVPPHILASLIKVISDMLRSQCINDLAAMRDLWKLINNDLEQVSLRHETAPIALVLSVLDSGSYEQMLSRTVIFQRTFESERRKPSITEILMSVRKYPMLLITILMYGSYTGLTIRWHNSQALQKYLQYAFGVLIVLGILETIKAAMKGRSESNERELAKAKELIRSEIKRFLADAQRLWIAAIKQNLNDQSRELLARWEAGTRQQLARRAMKIAEDRQQLQVQSQGLVNAEKRLATIMRQRDGVASALSQLQMQLRQLLSETNIRSARG